jgi:hypothetical protein
MQNEINLENYVVRFGECTKPKVYVKSVDPFGNTFYKFVEGNSEDYQYMFKEILYVLDHFRNESEKANRLSKNIFNIVSNAIHQEVSYETAVRDIYDSLWPEHRYDKHED